MPLKMPKSGAERTRLWRERKRKRFSELLTKCENLLPNSLDPQGSSLLNVTIAYEKKHVEKTTMEAKAIMVDHCKDIGANLTDPMFRGIYGGKQKHQNDYNNMLKRAWNEGLQKMIITVGTLREADEALSLAALDERLFVTMGCHPTRCRDFLKNPEAYYNGLRSKIAQNRNKVVAIGECGLDYDRLHFCEKETQKPYFEKQLSLAAEFQLPLFLHCRNSYVDFMQILQRNREKLTNGAVVHSFDGTAEQAKQVLAFDNFYIGLNGCSLKTAENLQVVKNIPIERIMLETDCPWCSVKPSHASHAYVQTKFPAVKKKEKWTSETLIDGRCEPCQIRQVLEIVAGIKDEDPQKLADVFYQNTLNLFFSKEKSV